MQVIRPKLSGFCPGVRNAVKKLFQEKKKIGLNPIYAYGNIINNSNYIAYLGEHRIQTVETTDNLAQGSYVAIRTHGINRQEELLLKIRFNTIDLTCVNVKRVQLSISDHSRQGYFIVITGKKDHPEIKGLISYAQDYLVIENYPELELFLKQDLSHLKEKGYNKLFIVSQTTGSQDLFEQTVTGIKKICGKQMEVAIYDSICPVTERKEQEALRLQKQVDITFVVGDTISSNANKLYNILSGAKTPVYFIADLKELLSLKLPLSTYSEALVVSSASTPLFIEEEICNYLKKI
jgi:4-hydroxy-3-methylbut-2-enyl diphosphate reductase